jgi:hypothetical protein
MSYGGFDGLEVSNNPEVEVEVEPEKAATAPGLDPRLRYLLYLSDEELRELKLDPAEARTIARSLVDNK